MEKMKNNATGSLFLEDSDYSPGNMLIASLPGPELKRILPILNSYPLYAKRILYSAGDDVSSVYFPCSGLISQMSVLSDGAAFEVMSIGREGVFGAIAAFGPRTSAHEVTVQVPGEAWRVSADQFVSVLETCPTFKHRIMHHVHACFVEVAQTAACAGRHTVSQRCASKLLIASARAGSTTLPLTHESLASALGVRRAGVTVAIIGLEEAGSIQRRRGYIEIVDSEQLRAAACECINSRRIDNRKPWGASPQY